MHSYSVRLGQLPPHTKVRTVLTMDQCRYWPDYIQPLTNLSCASLNTGPPTYRPPSLCTARTWAHPHLTYIPHPSVNTTCLYKQSRERREASNTHIYVTPTTHALLPYATYHITQGLDPTTHGVTTSLDHMQALC